LCLRGAYFGKPIICTDAGIAKDVIGKNEGGKIVKHKDVKETTDAIIELLTNNMKYTQSKNFLKFIISNFYIDNVADQFEKLFLKINNE